MSAQNQQHYYTIGEAAQILGVAIDTLRRWEKAGKISSIRSAGGMRLFPVFEIERITPQMQTLKDTLTVSEAAQFLGVSAATLRRWDKEGKLLPERNAVHERVYTKDQLETFATRVAKDTTSVSVQNPVSFLKERMQDFSDTFMALVVDKWEPLDWQKKVVLASTLLLILVVSIFLLKQSGNETETKELTNADFTNDVRALAFNADKKGLPVFRPSLQSEVRQVGLQVVLLPKQAQLANGFENASTTTLLMQATEANEPIAIQHAQFPIVLANPAPLPSQSTMQFTTTSLEPFADLTLVSQPIPEEISSLFKGSATLEAQNINVFVLVPTLKENTKVFLSKTGSIGSSIQVTRKIPGSGFVVAIDEAHTQPVQFDWLVVN